MKKKEIVTLALTTALLMTAHAVPASAASNAPESMSQTGSIQTMSWEKGVCRLYVDATNITDTRYCDLGGIRLPGAWVTGGVVLTIGR